MIEPTGVEENIKALRPKLLPTEAEMDLYERKVIETLHQELQKAREEERERCIQAIKNPLTNWECTANLEDGDAHNHKTITVCRAVASINSDKTNGL